MPEPSMWSSGIADLGMTSMEADPRPLPACGREMFARRVAIMGADPANADTSDPVPPAFLTEPDVKVQPHQPWARDVMILAGLADGVPWLWLACRRCGWFLGFSGQYDPAALAYTADEHSAGCSEAAENAAGEH